MTEARNVGRVRELHTDVTARVIASLSSHFIVDRQCGVCCDMSTVDLIFTAFVRRGGKSVNTV
jgi:hypothetical protein